MTFREAAIAVTYRCNSKCIMCSIWKSPSTEELEPSMYSRIPSSLRTINITGGEPFLRSDLSEVITVIHDRVPGSRIVFSSNGFLTERIVETMMKIRAVHPRVGVGISIDGLEQTHDRIRGVPGMFKRAIATVKSLKDRGFTDLRIAMTVTNENQSEIIDVFELSRDLGVEFTITMAHGSDIYFGELDDGLNADRSELLKETGELIHRQLKSKHPKDWLRAYHTMGMVDEAVKKYFETRCEAGRRYFFMSPKGDVYPCNALDLSVGNISTVKSLDELFTPSERMRVGNAVRSCRKGCWMICNTRSLILRHPVKAGLWVMSSKLCGRKD